MINYSLVTFGNKLLYHVCLGMKLFFANGNASALQLTLAQSTLQYTNFDKSPRHRLALNIKLTIYFESFTLWNIRFNKFMF